MCVRDGCEYCGAEFQTMDHLTFDCPYFHATRSEVDKELADLDPQPLPLVVKLGIAPAISHQADHAFLGSSIGQVSKMVKKLLGCRPPPYDNYEAMRLQERLKDQGISARQAIACAKGGYGEGEFPTYPEEVQGLPPDKPNAYTDGGLKKTDQSPMVVCQFWHMDPAISACSKGQQ